MNLWERTKSIAKLYTGTFIVVMILNQLLFFGFCLNPICIVAAMPHVLFITALIGSWLNKESGWGDDEQSGKIGEIYKESKKMVDNSLTQTVTELKRANELASEKIRKEQIYEGSFDTLDSKYLEIIDTKESESDIDYSTCQICGAETILRTATRGLYAGKSFYGCSKFPKCKGIINIKNTKKVENDEFDDDIPF
jgi:hypothetical protein